MFNNPHTYTKRVANPIKTQNKMKKNLAIVISAAILLFSCSVKSLPQTKNFKVIRVVNDSQFIAQSGNRKALFPFNADSIYIGKTIIVSIGH